VQFKKPASYHTGDHPSVDRHVLMLMVLKNETATGDGMAKNKKQGSEAAHEQRKARMRAYYRKNRDQWRKYNRDALARMSDFERDAHREQQRAYYRAHYTKHREQIIARTARYQKKHSGWFAAYRAEWYQDNKTKVAERRRRHYHAVVKPRDNAAKASSEFVTLREAVTLLGAKLRPFREWVYQGRIPAVRTPGGRYLFHRDEVDYIRATCHHYPKEIRDRLGLKPKGVCK
jgi:excisionase family DNA binding protein